MMKCEASEEFATSTAWMFDAYSWPMRWKTRSAPVRSTRTEMPGYFASNDFPIFSASGRSTEVYQTTLPSFFAASISCGVTGLAAGAADSTCVENALLAASAPVPTKRVRREIGKSVISVSSFSLVRFYILSSASPCERPAPIGRQTQIHCAALRDVLPRSRENAQLSPILRLDHV